MNDIIINSIRYSGSGHSVIFLLKRNNLLLWPTYADFFSLKSSHHASKYNCKLTLEHSNSFMYTTLKSIFNIPLNLHVINMIFFARKNIQTFIHRDELWVKNSHKSKNAKCNTCNAHRQTLYLI